ncbi:MAG: hypothetical protein DCC71_15575 [Proteobacteria bacterium]|nr:MAG: hypothetical protein DCC71_15575 [Pseudomonadota bacterium]
MPLALVAMRCIPGPKPSATAGALAERVRAFERFETAGSIWADWDNPFDPEQVRLDGEFRAPDGSTLAMPGFYTRDFRRALVGDFEQLAPRPQPHWRVRMTPTQPGTWEWRWVVTTPAGTATTEWTAFEVEPAAPDRHGFLRRSPRDGRYLAWDDGTPYVAIGENLAWYDGRGTYAYDDWIPKLAAQGVNYVRLWMPSWAFGIEQDALGDYTNRLDRAWQLDHVLALAERHGIAVMLCIQNHGPFSLEANSEWESNPYNAANGGPLAAPADFFTDPAARALFERRLRYLVARWGYATHLLAWELWNEVDLVATGPAVEAWHADMARLLRVLDPYDHLVTTSLARGNASPLWSLPELDLVQIHHYAFPLAYDIPSTIAQRLRLQRNAHPGKPQLLGEHGADYRGPAETLALDPESIGFHHGNWIGLVGGGFGAGMTWWWDDLIDPEDLYFRFAPLARFVAGVAFDAQDFTAIRPAVAADGRNLAAYALRGESVVLAWVQNADHQWSLDPLPGPDPEEVLGAALTLTGLADGAWTARWIDTRTGADVAVEPVAFSGGTVVLAVPIFREDIALRFER